MPLISTTMPSDRNASQTKAWVALGLMVLIVGAFGGTAREDLAQVAVLRPLAALMLIPAIYWFAWDRTKGLRFLLLLVGLLAVWMAVQLVPLPPDIWQNLPGRAPVANLDVLIGNSDHWRPISMAPVRSWNALSSLIVPVTALLLVVSLQAKSRMLLWLLAALGLVNALLGLMQKAAGNGALHFYRITNENGPVGLLANENHSATFSALSMLVVAYLASEARKRNDPMWLRFAYPAAYLMMLLVVLVNGSRAGLVFGFFAVLVSLIMFRPKNGEKSPPSSAQRQGGFAVNKAALTKWVFGISAAAIVGLILIFAFFNDVPALQQLLTKDPFDDLRTLLFPTISKMLATFWLLGVGFGAFKDSYHQFEATELLMPRYVNHAHNDWMQIVIEGGLPATLILIASLIWFAVNVIKMIKARGLLSSAILFWVGCLAIIGAASIVDYPLRTPIFQFFGIWLLASLAIENFRKGPSDKSLEQRRKIEFAH
ncbi:MAG: O-antigen ligase family protein [Erythrobacter sp.]